MEEKCFVCNEVLVFKKRLKNPDWFPLGNKHRCKKCIQKKLIRKNTAIKPFELPKEEEHIKCRVCGKKYNKKRTRGERFHFMCINCEQFEKYE